MLQYGDNQIVVQKRGDFMSKWAVIYSSVTGNTKLIAEAIAKAAETTAIFNLKEVPTDLTDYDVVALGYWLRLGQPEPTMLKYLSQISDKKVVLFQTSGAEPDSEHVITSFARAAYQLGEGCEIVGTFGCQGKINPALIEKRRREGTMGPHNNANSEKRWQKAATHPDENDVAMAKDFVKKMQRKMQMKAAFLESKNHQ